MLILSFPAFSYEAHEWPELRRVHVVYVPLPYQANGD